MNFNNTKIRQAEAQDIPEIAEIKVVGWQSAYRGIIDDEYLVSMDVPEQIDNLKKYSLETLFVAENDNEILGFCKIYDYDKPVYADKEIDCEIREIYVKPDIKRMGTGSKLFAYTLKYFKEKGKKKLYLGCFKENYSARKFYEKMGGSLGTENDIEIDGKNYPIVSYIYNLSDLKGRRQMNIILTGARGFVGARVLDYLRSCGHSVECIGSEELRGELTGDRYDALIRRFEQAQPDAVIHTAAISDMGCAERDPQASYLANVRLPEIMAELSVRFGCKLISCSSDQVYNGTKHILLHREEENAAPANVYGRHKLEGEQRVAEIAPDAVSLRLTWMYDMPLYRQHTNFGFPLQLMRAAAEDKPMRFSGNHFRGMTYVRTVAENMEKAIALPGGVYNFGSENSLDMYSTALAFCRALGLEARAEKLILPFEEEANSLAMDCSRLRSFGITFETTVEGPVKMMADYQG